MVGHTCNPSILDAEFSRYIVYLRPVSGYTRRFYQKTIKKEKKRIEESKKAARGRGGGGGGTDREGEGGEQGSENYLSSSLSKPTWDIYLVEEVNFLSHWRISH